MVFFWAWTQGVGAIFEPYAGYLHLVPRLVAAVAVALDPMWAPALFVGTAFATTLYVAALTQSNRCPLPRHPIFAFAVVLVPDAFEVLLNVVNLQWILAVGFILLLISADSRSRAQRWHDGVAAAVFGLTGPFSVILSPLFAYRAWVRRTPASILIAAIVLGCGAIQMWFIGQAEATAARGPFHPEMLLAVTGLRVLGSLFAGYFMPQEISLVPGILLGLGTVAGIALLAAPPGRAQPERRWLGVIFGLLLVSSLYRHWDVLPEFQQRRYGARYFYPIQLLALWLLLAAIWHQRQWMARTATVLAVWFVVINAPRLREPALEDLQWREHAARIRAGEAVEVPVNPRPWSIPFPARDAQD